MKSLMIIIGALAFAGAAVCQATPSDVTNTLPLNAVAVTNDYAATFNGQPVEFISVDNLATFSNTVTVASFAGGVAQATLYSGTLLAGGTATVYPVRAADDGATTNRPHYVSVVRVVIASASGATNTTYGPVRVFIQPR